MAIAPSRGSFTDSIGVQVLDGCVVVTAEGDIDAANAESFAAYALTHIDGSKPLIVDLCGLEFFGTAGFAALHTMNVQCAAADVRWAVSASGAVARVLRICDPEGALPVAGDVAAARHLATRNLNLFELIPEPGQRPGQ